jgi:hypothetical protein
MNGIEGFTGDIINLLSAGGREKLRTLIREHSNGEPVPDFIRRGLGSSIVPLIENAPDIVKQMVARAFLNHVDWNAVAAWAMVNPEDN